MVEGCPENVPENVLLLLLLLSSQEGCLLRARQHENQESPIFSTSIESASEYSSHHKL